MKPYEGEDCTRGFFGCFCKRNGIRTVGFHEPGGPALDLPSDEHTRPTLDLTEKTPLQSLAAEVGELVSEKQKAYGDSITKTVDILKSLFPSGVPVYAYSDLLLIVRMLDKFSRLATRGEDGKDLGGEDAWKDLCGYSLLGLAKERKR